MFASLRLADGPTFAHELPSVLGSEHVVLSCCDVGRSRVRPGDEALGLTAALHHLGVRSVLASVTPVDDATASEAMIGYHRALASGVDAASALSAMHRDHPQMRGFILFGDTWLP